jgi:hypothetical protein
MKSLTVFAQGILGIQILGKSQAVLEMHIGRFFSKIRIFGLQFGKYKARSFVIFASQKT